MPEKNASSAAFSPAGVTAFTVFVPAVASDVVASWTTPFWEVLAVFGVTLPEDTEKYVELNLHTPSVLVLAVFGDKKPSASTVKCVLFGLTTPGTAVAVVPATAIAHPIVLPEMRSAGPSVSVTLDSFVMGKT